MGPIAWPSQISKTWPLLLPAVSQGGARAFSKVRRTVILANTGGFALNVLDFVIRNPYFRLQCPQNLSTGSSPAGPSRAQRLLTSQGLRDGAWHVGKAEGTYLRTSNAPEL